MAINTTDKPKRGRPPGVKTEKIKKGNWI
jgi:hypothetical protein